MVDVNKIIDIMNSWDRNKVLNGGGLVPRSGIPYTPFPEVPTPSTGIPYTPFPEVKQPVSDNVSFTDEMYFAPSGFQVDDVLVPKKPTTNADVWFEPFPQQGAVSYKGGFTPEETEIITQASITNPNNPKEAIDAMQVMSANNLLPKNESSEPNDQSDNGLTVDDVDLSRAAQQRRRRSPMEQAASRAIDAFDFISGVDKEAYMGKNLAREVEYEKKLAEEDPEGYQADINRAKVLSQRAYATKDVELKKKYGAAIKRLLPYETQGMDDLTASEFYTSSEKMDIEKLKAANRMSLQQLKGAQALAQLGVKGDNALTLAEVQGEIKQALQDSAKLADYQRAKYVADRAAEGKVEVAGINADAKNYATDVGYQKAVDVANIGAQSRENVANINATSRENVANINAASREKVADINAKNRIDVANINALSRQQAAQLKAAAKASANGANAVGDVIPSEGVVNAVKLIEENPGQFDETASLVDTKIGRWLGLLGDKAISNRAEATMALQEAVLGSVMNLMQLFPKGGASVINSGTEQKRFAPIAEIIANKRGKEIVPALKSYYGGLYDSAQKVAGERAPISREEYVNLMVYGNTKGKAGGGLTMIPRDTLGMSQAGMPVITKQQDGSDMVSL